MKYFIVGACALLSSACSYLQTVGVLNDRADEYKKAQVFHSPLAEKPQFTNKYPIPDVPQTQDAPSPDELLRPDFGFIPHAAEQNKRIAYSLQSQKTLAVYLGTSVSGDTALLLRGIEQAQAIVLLNNAQLGLQQAESKWHAQQATIVLEPVYFVTNTMLVLLPTADAKRNDEYRQEEDVPPFFYRTKEDPTVRAFATQLQARLVQLLHQS